jgi:hypothetical protein
VCGDAGAATGRQQDCRGESGKQAARDVDTSSFCRAHYAASTVAPWVTPIPTCISLGWRALTLTLRCGADRCRGERPGTEHVRPLLFAVVDEPLVNLLAPSSCLTARQSILIGAQAVSLTEGSPIPRYSSLTLKCCILVIQPTEKARYMNDDTTSFAREVEDRANSDGSCCYCESGVRFESRWRKNLDFQLSDKRWMGLLVHTL